MEIIECKGLPKPVKPLSQAVRTGNLLFVSGQVCKERPEGFTFKDETRAVMEKLRVILSEVGLTFHNVCKVNVYLSDFSNAPEFDEVYGSYFDEGYPARCCVEVKRLSGEVGVEVELIAEISK